MPRPIKWRKVAHIPQNTYFIPCPKGKCKLRQPVEEQVLKVEELEAIRLKDIENLSQEECAEKMRISRQTFQNIIDEGRRKVAIALVQGKAISIGGGNYTTHICQVYCDDCGRTSEVSFESGDIRCQSCGSAELLCGKTGDCDQESCRTEGCDS